MCRYYEIIYTQVPETEKAVGQSEEIQAAKRFGEWPAECLEGGEQAAPGRPLLRTSYQGNKEVRPWI